MSQAMLVFYWLPGAFFLFGAFFLLWRSVRSQTCRDWHVCAALFLTILVGRIPTLFIPIYLNPDEPYLLAIAMKFWEYPVPWVSMDPETSGPINAFALFPLHLLGMPWGIPLARTTGILLISIHVCLLYLALRRLGDRTSAFISTLPLASFFAFVSQWDFMHYSSELAALALISLMLLLFARMAVKEGEKPFSRGRFLAIGVVAFAISMAKLQSLPLATSIGLIGILHLAARGKWRWQYLFWASGGALACLLALVVLLGLMHEFDTFHISYLQLAKFKRIAALTLPQLIEFALYAIELRWLVAMFGILFALGLLASFVFRVQDRSTREVALRCGAIVVVAAGCYVTLVTSGQRFPHYLNFLPVALALICFHLLPLWSLSTRPMTELRHAES